MVKLELSVLDANGNTLASQTADDRVSLLYPDEYNVCDTIMLRANSEGQYLVIQLEDTMSPATVFVPGNQLTYKIPMDTDRICLCPRSFLGKAHLINARVARPNEIAARRNLAFNPYDTHGDHGFYPHAQANVETRNEAVFAARNAIDGIFENAGHGEWPFQSWGINRNPNAKLRLTFGQCVSVDEIRLTLRADFPHDSWWTHASITFSDGSEEQFNLQKLAIPQCFTFTSKTVDWLELHDLVKADDESPFPALSQLEVWGTLQTRDIRATTSN